MCAKDLTHKLMNNEHVIYIDESTFHQWRRPTKMWLHTVHNDVPIAAKRGRSILAIGGLSNKKGMLALKITAEPNTKDTFIEFFNQLMLNLDSERATIVLDNLRSHHSKEIEAIAEAHGVELLFLPPYTCEFNPIETVWSLIKRQWAKKLIENLGKDMTEDEMIAALYEIANSNTKEKYKNIARAHYCALALSIRQGKLI